VEKEETKKAQKKKKEKTGKIQVGLADNGSFLIIFSEFFC